MNDLVHWHVDNGVLFRGDAERYPLRDLTRETRAGLPLSWNPDWRRCYPNLVVHPLWGDAITVATDGVHVIIDIGDGATYEVAATSLRGPVGPQRVHPDDWDWERNKRKVLVFRRGDGLPPAIIPVCREMDKHWERHGKISRIEHEAYVALWRGAPPSECDNIVAQLTAADEARREKLAEKRKSNKHKTGKAKVAKQHNLALTLLQTLLQASEASNSSIEPLSLMQ